MRLLRILIAGFEPFGGEKVNPSAEVARAIAADPPAGAQVEAAVLPVAFGEDLRIAWPVWERLRPDLVLGLGQSGGAAAIRIERFAHNLRADPGQPESEAPIDPSGPAAYAATIPVLEIARALRESGIPAVVSRDAGTYLCNHFFYHALRRADDEGNGTAVGFLHVPYLPEQAAAHPGAPSMSLEVIMAAASLAIDAGARSNASAAPAPSPSLHEYAFGNMQMR